MRRSVLIVDDDDDVREVAAASLELTRGWEVLTASCGHEALAVAQRSAPDAILLDVMMPDMDGPTLFGMLRTDRRTCEIPVILLTAKAQAQDRQRYLRIGVRDVIAKPFDPLTLADTIAAILRW